MQGSEQTDYRIAASILCTSRVTEVISWSSLCSVALREGTAASSNKSSTTHDRGMSETFSIFFHDKIAKAKAKVSTLRAQLTPNSPKPRPPLAMDNDLLDVLAETSVSEVSKLISQNCQTRHHRSTTSHTSVLKSCSDVLSPLIAHLANLSFFARGGFLTASR